MKLRLYTLTLMLLIGSAFNFAKAQTEMDIDANSKTYSQIFDSLSTGLIPSRIPYGILYDRVYGWSGLDNWQSGDTTSLSRLFQSWYDIEQSYTDSTLRPNRYNDMRTKVQQNIYAVNLPIVTLSNNFYCDRYFSVYSWKGSTCVSTFLNYKIVRFNFFSQT